MPKYAGYISRDVIDWSSIAKGLQQSVDRGLEQRRKKIEEDNKLFEDAKKKLGEYENTQSASYNTKAYQLTDKARTYLSDLQKQLRNGEITRSEYKIKVNNTYDQYDSFLNTSKGLDQYLIAVKKKIDEGAGREFVAKANSNLSFMGLSDGTADLQIDGSGNIYVVDANTKQTKSIKEWTNIENLSDGKIDLAAEMSKYTDKLAQVVREKTLASGASVTTDDPRQMTEQYNAYKANTIAAIANRNNPEAIVSILLDNSDLGYEIYNSDEDIRKAVESEVQRQEYQNGKGVDLTEEQKNKIKDNIQSKAIMMNRVGNKLVSVVTDQMVKDAEMVAGQIFEAQVESKITEQAAPRYRSSGTTSGDEDEEEVNYTLYEKSLNAFNLPFAEKSGTPEREQAKKMSAQRLTSLSGGRYTFEWGTGSDKGFLIATEKGKKTPKVIKAKKYDEIVPILFGESGATGSDKAYEEYRKQREAYFNAGGQTTGGTKPKAY